MQGEDGRVSDRCLSALGGDKTRQPNLVDPIRCIRVRVVFPQELLDAAELLQDSRDRGGRRDVLHHAVRSTVGDAKALRPHGAANGWVSERAARDT